MMLVLPISFVPMVVDSFGTGRNIVLMVSALVGLLLMGVNVLVGKEKTVRTNSILWLLLVMVAYAWIQWWWRVAPGVKMRSVMEFGGVGTLSAWWVWLLLWLQTESDRENQIKWLSVAGIVAGVTSLGLFVIPASKLPIVWPKDNPLLNISSNWSITGSILGEVVLMVFLAIEWIKRLVAKLKKEEGYVMEAVATSLISLVALLDMFRLFRGGWLNLDNGTSWVIVAEAFKRSPIWGVGMGDFVEAFWLWRPASYNLTQYWTSGFKYASNGLFNLWAEMGLIGLVIAGVMGLRILSTKKNFNGILTIAVGLAMLLLPYNFVLMMVMVWLLAGLGGKRVELALKVDVGERKINVAPGLLMGVVVVVGGVAGYWNYRMLAGEIFMRQSMMAAAKNDGGNTYNLQIKAIGMSPLMAEYRRVYSQTNLSLASVLLSNKELSDEDKQKASVLIQQAVREAKSAISLEQTNPNYWVNLASIYRQIVGIVDGSADWSYQAYQQAVALEPANPMSKLDMGGLLFAAGRYEEADRAFESVVYTKNDLANGWYNWAHTAKKLNKLPDAVSRLTQALALVPVDSGDYEQASKELTDWKKELEALTKKQADAVKQETKPAETLETPKPLPTGTSGIIPVPTGDLNPPSMNQSNSGVTPTTAPTVAPTGAKTP
jgi:Tfp pilus assembly protein PilF